MYFVLVLQILLLSIGTNFAASYLLKSFRFQKRVQSKEARIAFVLSNVCLSTIWGGQLVFMLLGIFSAGTTLLLLSVVSSIYLMCLCKNDLDEFNFKKVNLTLLGIEILALILLVLSIFV